MDFCQVMAVLEVINPLLGLVKTGFFPAMLQVTLQLTEDLVCRLHPSCLHTSDVDGLVPHQCFQIVQGANLNTFKFSCTWLRKGLNVAVTAPLSLCSGALQLSSRNVILFVIFGSLEQMQNKPIVFVVFYLWSTVEVFRWAHHPPRSAVSPSLCVAACCDISSSSSTSGTRSTCWSTSAQSGRHWRGSDTTSRSFFTRWRLLLRVLHYLYCENSGIGLTM